MKIILCLLSFVFLISCNNSSLTTKNDGKRDVKDEEDKKYAYALVDVVKAGEVLDIIGAEHPHLDANNNLTLGAFPLTRHVQLSPYAIGKYEVDYKLWYSVRIEAEKRGYIFANKGLQGNFSGGGKSADDYKNIGKAPTKPSSEPSDDSDLSNYLHPVTCISWRDAIIWCNAYNEILSLKPVYYLPDGSVAKDSTEIKRDGAFKCATVDMVEIKDEGGFRLPTEAEWEAAARGGSPSIKEVWNYKYSGGNNISTVAWAEENSQERTHEVGGKSANTLEIFDMTGNVWEWCFDICTDNIFEYDSAYLESGVVINPKGAVIKNNPPDIEGYYGAERAMRGGCCDSSNDYCVATLRSDNFPYNRHRALGFRLAKSIR